MAMAPRSKRRARNRAMAMDGVVACGLAGDGTGVISPAEDAWIAEGMSAAVWF